MNVLQNRIDSFNNSLVKWPHNGNQVHKIEAFSKAGFYFVRRPKYPDSVRCFICDVELSQWKSGQSPFARHSKESPNCAWKWLNYPDANDKPLLVNKKDPATEPRGPTMRTARQATFNHHNFWPPNKSMLNKRKYPAGPKLADAGFFFSPTPTQISRIKCPYCRITISEPAINENILDKHHELSSNCTFFALSPNMRTTRSRRDTFGSTHTHDTFTTAQSHLEEDESIIETKKSASKRKTSKGALDQDNQIKSKRQRTITKEPTTDLLDDSIDNLIDAEPIKIVKRRKSKEIEKKTDTSNITSVWDIENAFSLPSVSRHTAFTFGKSSARRTLTSAKRVDTGIDIFANLKPSLIIKNPEMTTNAPSVPEVKNKKTTKEIHTIVQPVTDKIMNSRSQKKPATKLEIKATRKRTLSTTSISTSTPNKSLCLKVVMDPKPKEPGQTDAIDSTPTTVGSTPTTDDSTPNTIDSTKNFFRDKGKGRAVEYNTAPPTLQKKKISLSKSKNKGSSQLSLLNSFEGSDGSSSSGGHRSRSPEEPDITLPKVGSIAVTKVKRFNVPEGFIIHSRHSSESPSKSQSPQCKTIPSPVLKNASPLFEEKEYTSIHMTKPTEKQLVLSPEYRLSPEREHLPVSEPSPVYNSPLHKEIDPSTVRQRSFSPLSLEPERENENNIMFSRSPSPSESAVLSSKNEFIRGFVPSPPRMDMNFMQSTPSLETNNRLVSAFDIFGNNLLSPIIPMTRPSDLNNLQHTPIISHTGRTKNMIVADEDGNPIIKQRSMSPIVDELNIENICPEVTTSDEIKSMKVSEYIQSLIDMNIEKVKQQGLEKIKMIKDSSNQLCSALIASAGPQDQEEEYEY